MQLRSAKKGVLCASLALLLAFGAAACGGGGGENTNNANTARNGNTTPGGATTTTSNTAAPNNSSVATSPPETASQDNALRNTVEANLTKAGVTGVTVSVSNGEVTLKGDIARAKLQDAMKAANDANPKRVNNQMNIK